MNDSSGFIAIVADMHLAPIESTGIDKPQSPEVLPERRMKHLESVLGEIVTGPTPAAVIFGGDCSNLLWSEPEYREYALNFMQRFPAPRYAVPGNHDVGLSVGSPRHNSEQMEVAYAAFREDWGGPWELEAAGFRILGINTQLFGSDTPLTREQELAEPSELLRVLFGHTPPFFHALDDDFNDGTELMMLPPTARKSMTEALAAHPLDLLITAHTHRFFMGRQSKWDWLGVPSTALGQDELWVPTDNFPPGDDHVGWVSLRRDGSEWAAEMHYCQSS